MNDPQPAWNPAPQQSWNPAPGAAPTGGPAPLAVILRHELHAMRKDWWWFLLLGLALVVLGTAALGSAVIASEAAVVFFGLMLLAGGIAQVISAFWVGKWSGFLVNLLVGLLYILTGFFIIDAPLESAVALTLLLAMMFFVSGLFKIVAALTIRYPMWGWSLASGVISLMLGVMIYRQWPASGLWVIGMFVGIELIFNGWTWIMLSIGLRALPDHE
jgi:uncharacterized membrane protein HdeD (DUF308 family)